MHDKMTQIVLSRSNVNPNSKSDTFKTSHKQELSPIMLPFSYCINPTLLIGRKFHHHGVESNKESADFQGEVRESIQILFQFII